MLKCYQHFLWEEKFQSFFFLHFLKFQKHQHIAFRARKKWASKVKAKFHAWGRRRVRNCSSVNPSISVVSSGILLASPIHILVTKGAAFLPVLGCPQPPPTKSPPQCSPRSGKTAAHWVSRHETWRIRLLPDVAAPPASISTFCAVQHTLQWVLLQPTLRGSPLTPYSLLFTAGGTHFCLHRCISGHLGQHRQGSRDSQTLHRILIRLNKDSKQYSGCMPQTRALDLISRTAARENLETYLFSVQTPFWKAVYFPVWRRAEKID